MGSAGVWGGGVATASMRPRAHATTGARSAGAWRRRKAWRTARPRGTIHRPRPWARAAPIWMRAPSPAHLEHQAAVVSAQLDGGLGSVGGRGQWGGERPVPAAPSHRSAAPAAVSASRRRTPRRTPSAWRQRTPRRPGPRGGPGAPWPGPWLPPWRCRSRGGPLLLLGGWSAVRCVCWECWSGGIPPATPENALENMTLTDRPSLPLTVPIGW